MKQYYVYIITRPTGTLYTGMTNNLERRVQQHRNDMCAACLAGGRSVAASRPWSISRLTRSRWGRGDGEEGAPIRQWSGGQPIRPRMMVCRRL